MNVMNLSVSVFNLRHEIGTFSILWLNDVKKRNKNKNRKENKSVQHEICETTICWGVNKCFEAFRIERLNTLINCAIEKHVSVKFPKIINSFNVKAQKSLWPDINDAKCI